MWGLEPLFFSSRVTQPPSIVSGMLIAESVVSTAVTRGGGPAVVALLDAAGFAVVGPLSVVSPPLQAIDRPAPRQAKTATAVILKMECRQAMRLLNSVSRGSVIAMICLVGGNSLAS